MRKLLVFSVWLTAVITLGTGAIVLLTAPGEILSHAHASTARSVPNYFEQLQARADAEDRVVVWTGRGLDFGDSALVFDAVPVLFDREDIGRPIDGIQNRNTRREVMAARSRQSALLQHPRTAESFAMASLRRFVSDVETDARNGDLREIPMAQQASLLSTAVTVRDRADELSAAFAGATESQNLPEVPGTDCEYGTVCQGCYTLTYQSPSGGISFCSAACISCVPN